MRSIISIISFVGFGLSIIVHGATYFGIDLTIIPHVWLLHFAIFPVAIALIIAQFIDGVSGKKEFWNYFYEPMPMYLKYIVKAAGVYIVINFILMFILLKGGTPDVIDSSYVLHNHGNIIEELSEEEYHNKKAIVLRGFSGHWLYFYLIPGLYFWYDRKEYIEG